jgi:hypothetical protein
MAQVQVDVRLEKTQYLVGEPVFVFVDVRNVGDEPVGYSSCDSRFRLEVKGAERRVPPNIFGCFMGMGEGGGVCGVDHPPLLSPGETTTFKYLLKEYDLGAGQYAVSAVGKAGVRWKYYGEAVSASNALPPSPRHKETDPVPGAQFDRTMPLTVVASTAEGLRAALAPLVDAADAADAEERYHARAALIESAAPLLDSLIARFAENDGLKGPAIAALGRMATTSSRAHLRNLFRRSGDADRAAVVLALARVGDRDDAQFLTTVLTDGTVDPASRRYAALGLGRIGGDGAVRSLERALSGASEEVRPSIAMALGNTRSRAAVPVLIGMFGNNAAHNEVCGALITLTHRLWCDDGSPDDPAAKRTRWFRWWRQTGSRTSIYGPDNCPPDIFGVDSFFLR